MKPNERRKYGLATERRMKLFERKYIRPVFSVLAAEFKRAAKAYKAGRIQQYLGNLMAIEGLDEVLTEAYQEVALFYARKTTREINVSAREVKAFGLDQVFIDAIIEYLLQNLLNKAVWPITNTTKREIMGILSEGVQKGWGIDKMAFELEHTELPVWRARMIVRTELLQAQNLGKTLGAEESEWETDKEWIAARDHRTRHSHRRTDGKTVPENGRFAVPKRKGGVDMMNAPGDPTASAENVINCRCTVAFVARRDRNGRLIKKRKISVILPEQPGRQRLPVITV